MSFRESESDNRTVTMDMVEIDVLSWCADDIVVSTSVRSCVTGTAWSSEKLIVSDGIIDDRVNFPDWKVAVAGL